MKFPAFYISLLAILLCQTNVIQAQQKKGIAVVAHRGDWRNAPENSLLGLKYAIDMGVDVFELDLKKTKDGHLVLLHDQTIDRTLNGKGRPEEFTLDSLKTLRLKNGLGRATQQQIPTLEEFLKASKGKIKVDIDKGYTYFPDVVKLIQQLNMEDQVIINIDENISLIDVEKKYGAIPSNIVLMPVININKKGYEELIHSYKRRKNTVFQLIFSKEDTRALQFVQHLRREGYSIWLNSLWASLNAGHDDDTAVDLEQPEQSWGWLVKQGASYIQTDRPQELIQYLQRKSLRKR